MPLNRECCSTTCATAMYCLWRAQSSHLHDLEKFLQVMPSHPSGTQASCGNHDKCKDTVNPQQVCSGTCTVNSQTYGCNDGVLGLPGAAANQGYCTVSG